MSSHHSWADAHPEETPSYNSEIRFPDESVGDDTGPLTEVLKETHARGACRMRSRDVPGVSTNSRKQRQQRHCLHHFMHTLAPQTAKVAEQRMVRNPDICSGFPSPPHCDTGQHRQHVNRGDKGGIIYSCGANWER